MLDATPAASPLLETDPTAVAPRRRAASSRTARPLRQRLRTPLVASLVIQLVMAANDRMPSVDAISYFDTGRNWVSGRGYTRHGAPEMHFPPVAPVTLGLLQKLTGSEMMAWRFWNLSWGMAAVVLLTVIAWHLSHDDDVVVATAWFATAVPGTVVLAIRGGSGSELATVVLLLSSALVTLLTLDRSRQHSELRRTATLAGAGALAGIAYLTRPEALLPGATIGFALVLMCLRDKDLAWGARVLRMLRFAAAFGFAALLFIAPYVNYTHSNTGKWELTSKTQDASIDAWRAVAQNDRLERDQILYQIQPDGVSLGPKTRSLTALAKEHPRGWVTIAWINTTTVFHDYFGTPWKYGPVWDLIPIFLLVPGLMKIWSTRRSRSTLLFAVLGAWPLVTCFFFFALPRYLMMTTTVLIPFGAWGLVTLLRRVDRRPRRIAWWAVGILSILSFAVASWSLLPYSNTPERTEQRTAGQWIAANTPKDARIMTRSFHVQHYSHRAVVAMPSAEYRAMLEFARRMGVSYIVADETTIRRRRPEVYDILMRENGAPVGLELVYEFTQDGETVKVYKLNPPAPKSKQPPLPLGYVSD